MLRNRRKYPTYAPLDSIRYWNRNWFYHKNLGIEGKASGLPKFKDGPAQVLDSWKSCVDIDPPRPAEDGPEDRRAGRLRPAWFRLHAQLAEASDPAAAVSHQAPLPVYWYDGCNVCHPRLAAQRLRQSE